MSVFGFVSENVYDASEGDSVTSDENTEVASSDDTSQGQEQEQEKEQEQEQEQDALTRGGDDVIVPAPRNTNSEVEVPGANVSGSASGTEDATGVPAATAFVFLANAANSSFNGAEAEAEAEAEVEAEAGVAEAEAEAESEPEPSSMPESGPTEVETPTGSIFSFVQMSSSSLQEEPLSQHPDGGVEQGNARSQDVDHFSNDHDRSHTHDHEVINNLSSSDINADPSSPPSSSKSNTSSSTIPSSFLRSPSPPSPNYPTPSSYSSPPPPFLSSPVLSSTKPRINNPKTIKKKSSTTIFRPGYGRGADTDSEELASPPSPVPSTTPTSPPSPILSTTTTPPPSRFPSTPTAFPSSRVPSTLTTDTPPLETALDQDTPPLGTTQETLAKDSAKEVAQELAQDTAKDSSKGSPKDLTQDVEKPPQDATKDSANDLAKGLGKDFAKDSAHDSPQEKTQEQEKTAEPTKEAAQAGATREHVQNPIQEAESSIVSQNTEEQSISEVVRGLLDSIRVPNMESTPPPAPTEIATTLLANSKKLAQLHRTLNDFQKKLLEAEHTIKEAASKDLYDEADRWRDISAETQRTINQLTSDILEVTESTLEHQALYLQSSQQQQARNRVAIDRLNRFQDTRALEHRTASAQKMTQLRAEERAVVAKMEEIQRDIKHLSSDLQHLDEDEHETSNSALGAINSLQSQKNEITSQLSEVQQEINVLLAQLRTLQQKEASLQSDLKDIDLSISDENAKLTSSQSSIKNQRQSIKTKQKEYQAALNSLVAQKGQIGISETQLHHQAGTHKQDMDYILLQINTLEHRLSEQQKWYTGIQMVYSKKNKQAKLMKEHIDHMTSLADSSDTLQHQIQNFSDSITALRKTILETKEEIDRIDRAVPLLEEAKKNAREARRFQEAGRILEDIKTLQNKLLTKEIEFKQKSIEEEDVSMQLSNSQEKHAEVVQNISKAKSSYETQVYELLMDQKQYMEEFLAQFSVTEECKQEYENFQVELDLCQLALSQLSNSSGVSQENPSSQSKDSATTPKKDSLVEDTMEGESGLGRQTEIQNIIRQLEQLDVQITEAADIEDYQKASMLEEQANKLKQQLLDLRNGS